MDFEGDHDPNSTNKLNEEDKTEEAEEIVTIGEVIDTYKTMSETAGGLFGAQDETVCTFPEGYKPRQPLFSCLTCVPEPNKAGICYGCSLHCHEGHEIVELYTKRRFRCDCGNSKFSTKCTLYETKDAENIDNEYNQNFNGRFCVCKDTYPSENTNEDMVQCVMCEDWFHPSHIGCADDDRTSSSSDDVSVFCTDCISKVPFFAKLSVGEGVVCFSGAGTTTNALEKGFIVENLRERLCQCQNCLDLYNKSGIEFLLDTDDDVLKYEKENATQAESKDNACDANEVRALVREVGMEGAVQFYGEVNNLKEKMKEWMNGMKDEVVKAEDVKQFFDKLNQERIEKRRRIE